jgi:hypothetical protein
MIEEYKAMGVTLASYEVPAEIREFLAEHTRRRREEMYRIMEEKLWSDPGCVRSVLLPKPKRRVRRWLSRRWYCFVDWFLRRPDCDGCDRW